MTVLYSYICNICDGSNILWFFFLFFLVVSDEKVPLEIIRVLGSYERGYVRIFLPSEGRYTTHRGLKIRLLVLFTIV